MGLHDRLKTQQNGKEGVNLETAVAGVALASHDEPAPPDPYAELKTRVHHAVIAKVGPELFKRESTDDLSRPHLHRA